MTFSIPPSSHLLPHTYQRLPNDTPHFHTLPSRPDLRLKRETPHFPSSSFSSFPPQRQPQPPPQPQPFHHPTPDLYTHLQHQLQTRQIILRVHSLDSTSKLVLAQDPHASGFSVPHTNFDGLGPDEYAKIAQPLLGTTPIPTPTPTPTHGRISSAGPYLGSSGNGFQHGWAEGAFMRQQIIDHVNGVGLGVGLGVGARNGAGAYAGKGVARKIPWIVPSSGIDLDVCAEESLAVDHFRERENGTSLEQRFKTGYGVRCLKWPPAAGQRPLQLVDNERQNQRRGNDLDRPIVPSRFTSTLRGPIGLKDSNVAPGVSLSSNVTLATDEIDPWISCTRDIDWAIWYIAHRLSRSGSNIVPAVYLSVIAHPGIESTGRMSAGHGHHGDQTLQGSQESRARRELWIEPFANRPFRERFSLLQGQVAAYDRAMQRACSSGRIFGSSVLGTYTFTREELPLPLPSKFWKQSLGGSGLPVANPAGRRYNTGWTSHLRWSPLTDSWQGAYKTRSAESPLARHREQFGIQSLKARQQDHPPHPRYPLAPSHIYESPGQTSPAHVQRTWPNLAQQTSDQEPSRVHSFIGSSTEPARALAISFSSNGPQKSSARLQGQEAESLGHPTSISKSAKKRLQKQRQKAAFVTRHLKAVAGRDSESITRAGLLGLQSISGEALSGT